MKDMFPKGCDVVRIVTHPGVAVRIKHEAQQFEFHFIRAVETMAEEAGHPVKRKRTSCAYVVADPPQEPCSHDLEDVADKADNDLGAS